EPRRAHDVARDRVALETAREDRDRARRRGAEEVVERLDVAATKDRTRLHEALEAHDCADAPPEQAGVVGAVRFIAAQVPFEDVREPTAAPERGARTRIHEGGKRQRRHPLSIPAGRRLTSAAWGRSLVF